MIDQCFLHIGTEKTGTTSVQEFLATNRERLLKHRYLYPKSPGAVNHLGLTCYAQDNHKFDSVRRSRAILSPADVLNYRMKLTAELDSEIDASRAGAIVFSNEHLSSRLTTEVEIRRIKDLCDRYAKRTRVIVYIRDQVEFLKSRYIEGVKGGATRSLALPLGPGLIRLMDYKILLAPWRAVFGFENMIVRRFVTEDFFASDLLQDFESHIGIPVGTLEKTPRRNSALSKECIDFLRLFNEHVSHAAGNGRNPLRGNVVGLLEQIQGGTRFQVSPDVADYVESVTKDSNQFISREYFDSRYQPLFERARPVPANPHPDTNDQVSNIVRIAAYLWTQQQQALLDCQQMVKNPRGHQTR